MSNHPSENSAPDQTPTESAAEPAGATPAVSRESDPRAADTGGTEPSSEPVAPRSERATRPQEPRMAPVPSNGSIGTLPPDADIPPEKLDPDALKVIFRLRQYGHEAYLVGGCVRDLLVGKKPKDFDVATSALPNEVRDIFRNCRLIGRRFRLAHVYFKGGKIIEVSTFRANPTEVEATLQLMDEEAEAHEIAAHSELADAGAAQAPLGEGDLEGGLGALDTPAAADVPPEQNGNGNGNGEQGDDLLITTDNVFGTAEQDARRRDFTINGLFYDPAEGRTIDYVRGRRDLDRRLVRTIGDPEVRMREDPVRLLRAVRFATKLDFDLESRTYAAMEGAVEDLTRCSAPRLLEETFRLLRGGTSAPSLKLVAALDALKYLLPPIDEFLRKNGPEGEKLFYAYAAALDRRVVSSDLPLEDAILLATLLLPLARTSPAPQSEEGGRPSVGHAIESLLAELVRNSRLPRRIAERCRMILLAQRTLTGERRRRGGLAAFRRHPLFREALTLFEISVDATGEHREALEAWRTGGTPTFTPGSAPQPGQPGEGPGRKRRRRRRRGGRREGGEGGAPGAAAGGAEASQAGTAEEGGGRDDEGDDAGGDDDGGGEDDRGADDDRSGGEETE